MSATLPPTADLERPSDFGEFWQQSDAIPKLPSLMPEAETRSFSLTPEQHARRTRFRRPVLGVVLGLLAFTVLSASVYVVKNRAAARSEAADEKPVAAAASNALDTKPVAASNEAGRTPAPVAEQIALTSAVSATDQVLALAREPVATAANLQAWSQHAGQLSTEDQRRAEHDLSRLSVTGARTVQEAARLELAILWRATARRAKAQKVLLSLARTATDPLVRKYALDTLSTA